MKIYFCGSMTYDYSKANDYKLMIDCLNKYGKVLNEFVGSGILDNKDPLEEYNQDVDNLNEADILFADITLPSLGVGFEIGYFNNLNKPMYFLYDENRKTPSSLIRGIPKSKIITYKNIDDALEKLIKIMENAK